MDARPALAVSVRDVRHAFGAESVLAGVTFDLPRGSIGCLVGPSGCGKSTLLAMIGGLDRPAAGTIVHGFRRPAFVFQDPCLLPWRTARDNAGFGLTADGIGRSERRRRADALFADVGLDRRDGDKYPHALSGGMRQRVALARALAVEPDLLLLDEPFSALDVGLRRQMQTLVLRLIARRGLSALLVTHDLAEAVRLADRVVVLTPRPARVAAIHDIGAAFPLRDDGFVHAEVGRLLRRREVAAALGVTEPDAAPPGGFHDFEAARCGRLPDQETSWSTH